MKGSVALIVAAIVLAFGVQQIVWRAGQWKLGFYLHLFSERYQVVVAHGAAAAKPCKHAPDARAALRETSLHACQNFTMGLRGFDLATL
jgi:hypothetical protein